MVTNQEIEVRFPDIEKSTLMETLRRVGAEDRGEDLFEEMVFYLRPTATIPDEFVRLRKTRNGTKMTYKRFHEHSATGTTEIELEVNGIGRAKELLLAIGLVFIRHQQKKRHDFALGSCDVSIDEYPTCAPYVEIEGPSEEALKSVASSLGLDWKDAYMKNALHLLIEKRGLKAEGLKVFTFDRIEYA